MKSITFFLYILIFCTSCANTQPKNNIVQITDRCLTDSISISDIKGKKQSDGFMKTQITGRNTTNDYQKLEYKIVWIDNNGFIIQSILSNWRDVSADANQEFYITNISPNTKADDFKFYIRQNNKEIACNH